jgi:MYXO-CTERM domain-containing protein
MHHKSILVAGVIAALALPSTMAFADPPECKRWIVPIDDCAALGRPPGCSILPREEHLVKKQLNLASGRTACARWARSFRPDAKWRAEEHGPEGMKCYLLNSMGEVEDYTVIWKLTVIPEPHCYCTVEKGPHRSLEWNGPIAWYDALKLALHHFPSGLKKAILAENVLEPFAGTYQSDAPFDTFGVLQKTFLTEEDAAEIDHIIPRVDSHGCLCGEPTAANAAVISRELNASMSNTPPNWDRKRASMFEEFGVSCPDPSAGKYKGLPIPTPEESAFVSVNHQELDESLLDVPPDEKEETKSRKGMPTESTEPISSGCSTSQGGAGLLALALGAVFARRRQRVRA